MPALLYHIWFPPQLRVSCDLLGCRILELAGLETSQYNTKPHTFV